MTYIIIRSYLDCKLLKTDFLHKIYENLSLILKRFNSDKQSRYGKIKRSNCGRYRPL